MTDTLRVGDTFIHHRDPDPEWQRRLELLQPRQDNVPWLCIRWKAGTPDQPCQRWVVYEMLPLRLVGVELRSELDGPDPLTVGSFVQDSRLPSGRRFVSDALVSHDQWELYRQHRAYPLLVWVIQGTEGGHRWMLSPQEQKVLRLRGLPDDVPAPGDLPYSEPNERTYEMLARRDRLKKLEQANAYAKRTADPAAAVALDRQRATAAAQTELVAWLEVQVQQGLDAIPRQKLIDVVDAMPRGDGHYDRDRDAVDEAFLAGA